jgi:hypothetical protein
MSIPISPPIKLIRLRPDKNLAAVRISEDWVGLVGSKPKNFVTVDKGGVSIGGPLSYQGLPNQMVFCGLLTFPFFPIMFLPIGPSLVPSLALKKVTIAVMKLGAELSALVA